MSGDEFPSKHEPAGDSERHISSRQASFCSEDGDVPSSPSANCSVLESYHPHVISVHKRRNNKRRQPQRDDEFVNQLRHFMKEQHYTQFDMANNLNCSQAKVSHFLCCYMSEKAHARMVKLVREWWKKTDHSVGFAFRAKKNFGAAEDTNAEQLTQVFPARKRPRKVSDASSETSGSPGSTNSMPRTPPSGDNLMNDTPPNASMTPAFYQDFEHMRQDEWVSHNAPAVQISRESYFMRDDGMDSRGYGAAYHFHLPVAHQLTAESLSALPGSHHEPIRYADSRTNDNRYDAPVYGMYYEHRERHAVARTYHSNLTEEDILLAQELLELSRSRVDINEEYVYPN